VGGLSEGSIDFVHGAGKWSYGKEKFRPMSAADFQVVQELKKLMESANNRSNQVRAATPTSLISSHKKRFWEYFCVHALRLIMRPVMLGISGWALPQLVVIQFFKYPDLDFLHHACK
jgi:hypothetical protein